MGGEQPVQRAEPLLGGVRPVRSGGDVGELRGQVLGAEVQQSGEVGAAALDGGVGDVEPVGEGAEAQGGGPFLVEDAQGGDGDRVGGGPVQGG